MPRRKLDSPVYRLTKRGKFYYVAWTDPETGRSRAVSTGEIEESAAAIRRDEWVAGQEQPLPPAEPRISEIVDAYVADRKGHIEGVETLERSAAIIKRLIGNLEPCMLAPTAFAERRRRDGVADGTIRRQAGVLRAALSWATKQQPPWIDRAPHVAMPPIPPPRDRWLTHDEIDRLFEAAKSTHHVWLFIMLAYHTAARRSAILDLTWDRVDLQRGVIHYSRPGRRETKKRRASVPLNEEILAALKEARPLAVSDHVIEFKGNSVESVRTAFDKACTRAGIGDCSPHVLRHTSATHMVIAGVPVQEVARMLGDTVQMVEKIYGHHSPDYLRTAAASLVRYANDRDLLNRGVRRNR